MAAIATCGGITPGVNVVIRSLVKCLEELYKVKKVIGVRYGMFGLQQQDPKYWMPLTSADVSGIQIKGGSILGTDRVDFDAKLILKNLKEKGVT